MSTRVPQGLYAILDDGGLAPEIFPGAVVACWRAGVGCVQIRLKRQNDRVRLSVQRHVVEALSGVAFDPQRALVLMINDRVDLAAILTKEAPPLIDVGVHLGQDDMPPGLARQILGEDAIIGLSTHTLEQVRKAQELPVDYLGFGPVFHTDSKGDTDAVVGIAALSAACAQSRHPIIAIGGLDRHKGRQARRAGASAVAMISALTGVSDSEQEPYLEVLGRQAAFLVKELQ
jgi:thiamine-phosphate pyrophosphorylase